MNKNQSFREKNKVNPQKNKVNPLKKVITLASVPNDVPANFYNNLCNTLKRQYDPKLYSIFSQNNHKNNFGLNTLLSATKKIDHIEYLIKSLNPFLDDNELDNENKELIKNTLIYLNHLKSYYTLKKLNINPANIKKEVIVRYLKCLDEYSNIKNKKSKDFSR